MKIKIKLSQFFLDKTRKNNMIKTYDQLTNDEETAFWNVLRDILNNKNIDGKNKLSNTIDKYNTKTNSITSTEIKNINGIFFKDCNIWHYHLATNLFPYNQRQYYNCLTIPILSKNLQGLVSSFLIHYKKIVNNNEVIMEIIGLSHHNCWAELYSVLQNKE